MKSEYKIINLSNMILELGEDKCKSILSSFSCPKNKDVQDFLKIKAIEFSKQGLAATHLVFLHIDDSLKLIGYFTLSNKILSVGRQSLSNKLRGRISKFSTYDKGTHKYTLGAILIGQLGKNYNNDLNKQIKGEELLKMACDKVKEAQLDIGGKVVYLECEDDDYLKEFYSDNGFVNFGKRVLEKDEIDQINGKYLIQFLKYL